MVLTATEEVGDVTVTLLDHHRDPIAPSITARVGVGARALAFVLSKAVLDSRFGVEAVDVSVGDRHETTSSGL